MGEQPVLEGELCAPVMPEDCEWQLEKAACGTRKIITVTLTKVSPYGVGILGMVMILSFFASPSSITSNHVLYIVAG